MCEMQVYDTLALQKNNSGSLIAFRIAFASSSFISFGGSFSALIWCSELFPKEILRTSFGLELDGDSLLVLLGGGVTKAAVSASPDFADFALAAAFLRALGSGLLPLGADFERTLWVTFSGMVQNLLVTWSHKTALKSKEQNISNQRSFNIYSLILCTCSSHVQHAVPMCFPHGLLLMYLS